MKRGKGEIITCILGICTDGANKTKIVYQANLNFKTVNPYLELLSKNGLIEARRGSGIVYETTDKGIEVLENFRWIQSELSGL
jgi:predicted transcriptional regulator